MTPRRLIAPLAALIVSVISLVGAGSAGAASAPLFGVVSQNIPVAEDYDLMGAAGVQTLRLQLGWPLVQAEEGTCQASAPIGVCDWRSYDRIIGGAAARGIEVFPYLLNVPSFIAQDPDTPPVRSAEARRSWTGFVEAAVKRYGADGAYWTTVYPVDHPGATPVPIEHWQIWNEPSAAPFWHPRPKPREYGELVKITSSTITDVDPDAYIVLAGLFGTPVTEEGGIIQPEFLRALYRTPKIERYFDAVALHPYGPDLRRVRFQVKWALDEIDRARDKTDLWISEIGWASDRLHKQLGVGLKGQAKMLTRMFEMFRSKRAKWNVAGVNWYAWQDTDAEGLCDFCRRSGLVTIDNVPKPSYDAFSREANG